MNIIQDRLFDKYPHLYKYDNIVSYTEVRFYKWFEEFKSPVFFDGGRFRYTKVDGILALASILDLKRNFIKVFYFRPCDLNKFGSGRQTGYYSLFKIGDLYHYADHKKNDIYSGTKLYKIKNEHLEAMHDDYSMYLDEVFTEIQEERPGFNWVEISLIESEPIFKVDYELAIIDRKENTFVRDILNIGNVSKNYLLDYNIVNADL